MARLFASVAPDVKMISSGSAPMQLATLVLDDSVALFADHPVECSEECGLPWQSVQNGCIAARTVGRIGCLLDDQGKWSKGFSYQIGGHL